MIATTYRAEDIVGRAVPRLLAVAGIVKAESPI
jgi:hypothetical protein